MITILDIFQSQYGIPSIPYESSCYLIIMGYNEIELVKFPKATVTMPYWLFYFFLHLFIWYILGNFVALNKRVPAISLINTKEYIKLPLKIMLRKSIDEGKIPEVFKLAYVTPLHKGGSKMNPANYRPVSLTSHIMKVFERVIKMHLLKHLQENDLIKQNQHGFVSGRSTQTQLLQHYSDVSEALLEDKKIVYV